MPADIRLVPLAEGMTVARVAAWLKAEGDLVRAGEPVAEIETDKTTVEIEAPVGGYLGAILVPAGAEDVAVGAVLATIVDQADRASDARTAPPSSIVEPSPSVASVSPRIHDAAGPQHAERDSAGIPATPLARRMASIAGLDLAALAHESDRVHRADVERAIRAARSPQASDPSTLPARAAGGRTIALTPARRIAAARLQQAKQTIPHFYLEMECAADALLACRAALNARPDRPKLTVTDFIVRAAALALRDVPAANSSWVGPDDGVRLFDRVDVAVAVDTPSGLFTPVVRRADERPLDDLAAELRSLIRRARAGSLGPGEYAGGTFTISNLGMYGVTSLYPIVNPPQSAILGVGAAVARPVVRDGQVAAGTTITATLAADHRAIDGATGAEFLAAFRRLVEDPR